ncbi:MAG TPA: helix-turn-helix transcriptional regulator [Pseudomonadales bacterium]
MLGRNALNAPPDFSLTALYDALDHERQSRSTTWAVVAREINARFRDVRGHRAIAVSTITGLAGKQSVEGDGVLQMLLWLRRSPESFVPGFEGANAERYRLKELGPTQILRWDTRALYAALSHQRQARGVSWRQVAAEIRGCTPAMLTRLERGGRTVLPGVMRLVAWTGQPAAAFTRASDW